MALVASLVVYALLRYVARTPFGLTLQGVRDDPVRMASLGYNVVAPPDDRLRVRRRSSPAIGGVLFVWWNGHIDPASIDLGATIDVLVIAVIGGLYRLEGAWVGALFFVDHQQLLAADQLHRTAVPHADRRDLPRHRARLARWPHRPLGARASTLFSGRRGGPSDRTPVAVGQAEPSV